MLSAARWILRNTVESRESLTPQIALRLITETTPLWMATPDQCPLPDPYWAFYWPGGQAVSRYLLKEAAAIQGAAVLDFGAGCGAATIAACLSGAAEVLANDIDQNALLATRLNMKLNGVPHRNVVFSSKNLLLLDQAPLIRFFEERERRFLVLGDMFYDAEFARLLIKWLHRLHTSTKVRILVGDPGRHAFTEDASTKDYSTPFSKHCLASYPLPSYVTREHYGFTAAHVFEIKF